MYGNERKKIKNKETNYYVMNELTKRIKIVQYSSNKQHSDLHHLSHLIHYTKTVLSITQSNYRIKTNFFFSLSFASSPQLLLEDRPNFFDNNIAVRLKTK